MSDEWSVQQLLGVSSAYWKGCALQAGVRLEIFTHLDDKKMSLTDLSKAIQANTRGTELLLNALAGMRLLVKKGNIYNNTPFASQILSRNSKAYMGHIVLHHHHLVDGWAQLNDAVTTGKPVVKRSYGEEIERESFLMGMFNLAMGIAPGLTEQFDLWGRKKMLDLGGGPGTYAIYFCLANPSLKATIFDRSTTEPFALKTVKKFALADRINFASGDFTNDTISGGPFDVAWLSHILHSNDYDTCQHIITKTVGAMEEGGVILIHDFILDNNKDTPEHAALFALNMLINNAGRSYSKDEISKMLSKAGAKTIEHHPYRGPNGSSVLMATI